MAKQDTETAVVFPGEERWELWRLNGERYELADTAEPDPETGEVTPFKSATHYAFPVASASAVPIWAGTDDPSLLGDLVAMQLEKQGIRDDAAAGTHLEYRRVGTGRSAPAEEGAEPVTRTLLLATSLSPNYPHLLPGDGGRAFDISPRFLPLPGNHLVIWRELGRLVMALTRGGELVYFQGLTSGDLDVATVAEIKCVLLGLEGQGISAEPAGIYLWTEDVPDDAGAMLQDELGLDAIVTLRPDPAVPKSASALLPEEVAQARIRKKRAAKIRAAALAGAAVYAVLVGLYFWDYAKVVKEERRLAKQVEEMRPVAEWIGPFRGKWDQQVTPLIDKSYFPAHLVHQVNADVPAEGLRLTSFQLDSGVITLIGESSDTNKARQFYAALTADKNLKHMTWTWLQRPAVDPRKQDGTATFRLQGERKAGI